MVVAFAAIAVALTLFPGPAPADADIYRWEDERGVIHFTDNPATIPDNLRGKIQPILKEPPSPGKPSLSNVGNPSLPSSESSPDEKESAPPNETRWKGAPPTDVDTPAGQVETLRAKIDAKERFLEQVDNKRSNILNPMGNRFISTEDLELYKKYNEELPEDRERLREIESRLPAVR